MPSGVYHHKPHSPEWKREMSEKMMGNKNGLGFKHAPEAIEKIRRTSFERGKTLTGKYWLGRMAEKSAHWKGELCKARQERNDSAYKQWVSIVKRRDGNVCQLKDENCSGYNVAHHIKGWTQNPELRYEVKNGIILCQGHHPRKRGDEQRLIPTFETLVGSRN